MPLFWNIILNNIIVLALCFVTAFILGEGGLLLIILNASVWGTIFGNVAKNAAAATGKDPVVYFILVLIAVFPHMIMEAVAYFNAAFAGSQLSKGFCRHQLKSPEFKSHVYTMFGLLIIAIVILVAATAIEVYVLEHHEVYRTIIRQSFMR